MISAESKTFIANNIINNFIRAIESAVKYSRHPDSKMENVEGSLQYYSGCLFPFFNGVFSAKTIGNPEAYFSDITTFFEKKHVPFIWWWLQQTAIPDDIQEELAKQKFNFLGDYAGIAARVDSIDCTNSNPDIVIKEVTNEADYHSLMDITCDVFQLNDSIKQDLTAMFSSYGHNKLFRHYLGYYLDEPVGSLTSFIDDNNVVGLYNGAVLSHARKMGVGTALAKKAIYDANNHDCELVVSQLMASAMAKNAAIQLGFETYCELFPFTKVELAIK